MMILLRTLFAPGIAVALLLPAGAFAQRARTAVPISARGGFTESDRAALRSELRQLEDQLAALRRKPSLNQDCWADAHVFVKAVTWALDFGPIANEKDQEMVRRALRRAHERGAALRDARHPWTEKRGRVVRGFVSSVDGSTQPYGVVIPAGYDESKPMRLDVVLHGSRRMMGTGELLFMGGFDAAGDEDGPQAADVNYIEVHPLGRLGENAYRFEGETDVDEAIEAACRNYRIDRSRVVLRGSSLGGVGTWQLGLKRPDRYVALGPTAGPVDTYVFAATPRPHFIRLDPLPPWQKSMLHLVDAIDYAANAGMVPVVALMGDQDGYFPSHLLMERAFKKEGIPFVGLVDKGAGHGVTAKAFQEQLRLLGEHAAKAKDAAPKHIRFVTWTLKFSRCHWIELLGLEAHYQRAEIDARMAEDGSVTMVEPKNITRFAIRPPALQAASAKLTIGRSEVSLPRRQANAPGAIVIERKDGRWQYQGELDEIALSGKRPGLQGPIDDAFATRFVCVRGTGKPQNAAAGDWAAASLNRFADEWRRHYRGYLPVKDDTEVTEDDIRNSNLVLFGDPGSNRWIGEILPKLPLAWTSSEIRVGDERYAAAEYGLQLIFPNPLPGAAERYVVFNSGHTYHDAELRLSYMVFPRVGDWAVVKVGDNSPGRPDGAVAETVVQSGFFDEAWAKLVSP
jgi:dienelactone hydrolase